MDRTEGPRRYWPIDTPAETSPLVSDNITCDTLPQKKALLNTMLFVFQGSAEHGPHRGLLQILPHWYAVHWVPEAKSFSRATHACSLLSASCACRGSESHVPQPETACRRMTSTQHALVCINTAACIDTACINARRTSSTHPREPPQRHAASYQDQHGNLYTRQPCQ